MKQTVKTLFALLAVGLVAVSCSEDKIETYSGSTSVYFTTITKGVNATSMSYAFLDTEIVDSLITISVSFIGQVADYDRPVSIGVDQEYTTAVADVDYDPAFTCVIPAGQSSGKAKIRTLRSANLPDAPVILGLRLLPNEYFATEVKDLVYNKTSGSTLPALLYGVAISENNQRPPCWGDSGAAGTPFFYFGAYSVKKFALICALNNIPPAYFYTSEVGTEGFVQYADLTAFGGVLRHYLMDMERAGTPVYEEGGTTKMTAGTGSNNF